MIFMSIEIQSIVGYCIQTVILILSTKIITSKQILSSANWKLKKKSNGDYYQP